MSYQILNFVSVQTINPFILTVCDFKIDAKIQNVFPAFSCYTALPQPEGFFKKLEGFL